jgi:hypothetical protein
MPMASTSNLHRLLAAAYNERHRGYPTTLSEFQKSAANSKFHEQAKAEHDRLADLEKNLGCPLVQRCYVSHHQLHFLKAALALPVPPPQPTVTVEDDMPSKLKSLAEEAKSDVDEIEHNAEIALKNLKAAKARAQYGVDGINNVAAEIHQSADDLSDFAAQTSNFPPAEK